MRYIDIKFYENSIEKYGDETYIHWTFILDNENADIDKNKFDKNLPLRTFLNIVARSYLNGRDFFIKDINNVLNDYSEVETYGDIEVDVEITKEITTIEYMFDTKSLAPFFVPLDPNIKYGSRPLAKEEKYNEISTEELKELCIYCMGEIKKYEEEYASKGITLDY